MFSRDALPKKPFKNESGIINLDNTLGIGTHWVAYCKKGHKVNYYDSFGNLPPPIEFMKYMKNVENILYNRARHQSSDSTECGLLSLRFLLGKICNKF